MPAMPCPRAARGFTLVELLLATVLLALLVAGAWSGIRTATRAASSGEELIERTNRVRVAQEFLRRELTQSLALAYVDTEWCESADPISVAILGKPHAARILRAPPYDPTGSKLRG